MTRHALCGEIQDRFKGEIHPINEPVVADLSRTSGSLLLFEWMVWM